MNKYTRALVFGSTLNQFLNELGRKKVLANIIEQLTSGYKFKTLINNPIVKL